VSRDFEVVRNVSCEESTVRPVWGYFIVKYLIDSTEVNRAWLQLQLHMSTNNIPLALLILII